MFHRSFWLSKEIVLGLAFVAFLAVPVIVFGGSKAIYVDKDTSGNEDGSSEHPYHSIEKALNHAKDGSEVRVEKGTYKENITLPKGVKLVSASGDRDDVTIDADNDDKTAVTMKHGSEIDSITIKGGRYGIRIDNNAKAHIYDVTIKDSGRDGIHIDSADTDKSHRVIIDKTTVKNSGAAGVYAEKRYVIILDSDINNNDGDGIDLAVGSKAWLEENRINSNGGSGMKVSLDKSSIFGKKNGFRDNKREGIEVSAFGAAGTIELKRSAFVNNGRYGVARVARTASGATMFGNLSFGIGINSSKFLSNAFGEISAVVQSR